MKKRDDLFFVKPLLIGGLCFFVKKINLIGEK